MLLERVTMLETIDLSKKLSDAQYKKLLPPLQDRLRALQPRIRDAGLPVVIAFEGWDLAGKGGTMRLLTERLDPRGFKSYPIYPPSPQEKLSPFLRRFWLRLPAKGEIVFFDHSWYGRVLKERVEKLCKKADWKEAYQQINEFERQLVDDGMIIIKYWFHFTRKDQKKWLKKYLKDPFEKWQITPELLARCKKYDKYLVAAEEMLDRTSTTRAHWIIVEAADVRYARIKVFQTCIETLEEALHLRESKKKPERKSRKTALTTAARVLEEIPSLLDRVDLTKTLSKKEYIRQLNRAQIRLRELQFKIRKKFSVIVVYEGWDASGKGGNIRRFTEKLDPRWYEVQAIAAPTELEKSHHYLWRFWKGIPPQGMIGIFDRSWYGRVLVERVEGFCTPEEWKRAYPEIREFERQLHLHRTVLLKFWLHISKEEQLRRFEERQQLTYKRHKITEEDWRNRKKWDDYHDAVVEMLYRTSTTYAPWTIVEGNCKWWARVKAIRTAIEQIEEHLG